MYQNYIDIITFYQNTQIYVTTIFYRTIFYLILNLKKLLYVSSRLARHYSRQKIMPITKCHHVEVDVSGESYKNRQTQSSNDLPLDIL